MMFKEHSSAVRIPIFGEMKGGCLTMAKKRLYENELLSQTFDNTILSSLKTFPWNSFYIAVFGPNTSLPFHQIGGSNTTWHSLNIIKCQKWGEAPYQNMSFWETLRITLISKIVA